MPRRKGRQEVPPSLSRTWRGTGKKSAKVALSKTLKKFDCRLEIGEELTKRIAVEVKKKLRWRKGCSHCSLLNTMVVKILRSTKSVPKLYKITLCRNMRKDMEKESLLLFDLQKPGEPPNPWKAFRYENKLGCASVKSMFGWSFAKLSSSWPVPVKSNLSWDLHYIW